MALSTINSRSIAAGALRDSDLGTLDTLTVSGNATFDTSTLVVDAANNRVGVGTASPATALTIGSEGKLRLYRADNSRYGDIYNDNSFLNIETSNDPIKLSGQSYVRFDVSATERMRITSSGNVGIGTSSPSRKLELNNGGTGALVTFTDGIATNFTFKTDGSSVGTFGTEAGGTQLAFMVASSEKMRIDNSGNVGIGTSSPQKPLDVQVSAYDFATVGARTLGSGEWSGIHFGYRENNTAYRKSAIVFQRTDLTEGNAQGKIHILNGPQSGSGSATLSDAKITIAENGNVGIGTASPTYTLVVSEDGSDNIEIGAGIIQRYNRGTSSYGAMDYYAASHNFYTTGGGQHSLFINSSGDVGIGTSSPNSYAGYGTLTINGTSGGLLDFETAGTFVGEVYADGVNGLGLQAIGARNIKFSSGSVVHTIMRNNYITSRYTGLGYETINYLRSGGTYTHVKTNIYRGNNMYYIKVVGAGGYAGENTLSLLTGYAYAAHIGSTTSNYHGITNLGNYPITDVYYSSDNYLCFTIQSNVYAQYTVTMSSHATSYNTGQENLIASSVGNSSTARYYA